MPARARYKVRPWSPTSEQAQYLRDIEATSRFVHNLPDDLRRRYAGQWIAAKGCQIIAAAPTRAELCAKLPDPDDPTVLRIRLEKGVTIRWRNPL
jgi:hypothetical protein